MPRTLPNVPFPERHPTHFLVISTWTIWKSTLDHHHKISQILWPRLKPWNHRQLQHYYIARKYLKKVNGLDPQPQGGKRWKNPASGTFPRPSCGCSSSCISNWAAWGEIRWFWLVKPQNSWWPTKTDVETTNKPTTSRWFEIAEIWWNWGWFLVSALPTWMLLDRVM